MYKTAKWLMALLVAVIVSACGSSTFDEPEDPSKTNPDWNVVCWETLYDNHGLYENKSANCLTWKENHKKDLTRDDVVDGKRLMEWRFTVKDKSKEEMEIIAGDFMGFTVVGDPDGNGDQYMDHYYMQYDEIKK